MTKTLINVPGSFIPNLVNYINGAPEPLKSALIEEFNSAIGVVLDECAKARRERDEWKANHHQAVQRAALLRQRPDLPVDRIPAYEELTRLQGSILDVHIVDISFFEDMRLFAGQRSANKLFPTIPPCNKLAFKINSNQLVTESFFFSIINRAHFDSLQIDTPESNDTTLDEFERAARRLRELNARRAS